MPTTKYCTNSGCEFILKHVIQNNKLIFVCDVCKSVYDSNAEDTLLIDETLYEKNIIYKYETYLRNVHNDLLLAIIDKKCINENCDSNQVRVISLPDNDQSIYGCIKCSNKFM